MDGKDVLVVGHFFWHIHGTREASKIPLPIKVFSNEVLTNCPGAGEPFIAYGMTPPYSSGSKPAERSIRRCRLTVDSDNPVSAMISLRVGSLPVST